MTSLHFDRSVSHTVADLRCLPLFQGCTDKELHRVSSLTSQAAVAAGTVLCRQRAVGQQVFIVVSGEAEVWIDGDVVAVAHAGGVIGEMAVLEGAARTATVVAQTAMTVLVLTPREFDTLLNDVPHVARRLLATMSSRLRRANTPEPVS